jgi:hypothetical protein
MAMERDPYKKFKTFPSEKWERFIPTILSTTEIHRVTLGQIDHVLRVNYRKQ